jgi:hypothetical protein
MKHFTQAHCGSFLTHAAKETRQKSRIRLSSPVLLYFEGFPDPH